MKTKSVKCKSCGKKFDKPLNEYNRSKKKGRNFYCSRSCSGKAFVSHLKVYAGKFNENLITKTEDEFSPFRSHLRRASSRDKEVSVTIQDLKDVWESQIGICPYTRISLILPKSSGKNDPIRSASLDRIDSSKGYIKGNIQFVSMAANLAKYSMTHEQMLEFCQLIRSSN